MKTLAVIAEYNPFHNGHLYQLNRAKEITNADYAISIMSGNFLQRGEVAMWDKYTRAKMAALAGIDLVLELPFAYATGSAYDFATGAVCILNSLGTVNYLCFGAETDDLDTLNKVADILTNEPDSFKVLLKNYLDKGDSYPKARANALSDLFDNTSISDIVNKPNNILAIEYLCALKRTKSNIKPVLIKRVISNYHDTELKAELSSATAIRTALNKTNSSTVIELDSTINSITDSIKDNVPESTLNIIKDTFFNCSPIDNSLLDVFLQGKLLDVVNYSDYCDINASLSNKIKQLKTNITFNEAVELLKTKDITATRINRALLHLILGYTNTNRKVLEESNYALYANILGFRKESSNLIKSIAKNSSIPVITKKADFTPVNIASNILWNLDIKATSLYNCLIYNKYGIDMPNDFTTRLSIV